jgi:formylglycine-generating enzyme required for sulfatase activity
MKSGFFLKLGIAIVVAFGLLIAGFYFWKPLNIAYYKYRLTSEDIEARAAAVKYLLEADAIAPVKEYYTNRYASKDVKVRLAVVDELCGFGDKGKSLMYEIFRKRCMREQVLIPAGSFMMGSENGNDDEKPVHKVTLDTFWMDKYEVTNEKYYTFVKCTNYVQLNFWTPDMDLSEWGLYPVVNVSWEDATAYANWLKMRLPTEAEWEYACRSGSMTEYYFGDNSDELGDYAWFDNNSLGITHPVGLKKPNKWGLYDMQGNVWEWCWDCYDAHYYSKSPKDDPKGPDSGTYNVLRGGCGFTAWYCRSAFRYVDYNVIGDYIGFRVGRSAGQ